MKNILIILIVIVLAGCAQPSQKVVEVTGFASIKVDPDIVRVRIESFAQKMYVKIAA